MKFTLALGCFILVTVAAKETPITLCGRQLANARVMLCYGAEYVNTYKRTPPEILTDFLAFNEKWENLLWNGRRGALSADWARYKRVGLADECCLKPCTTDVILTYC